jgi:hypothetical protein
LKKALNISAVLYKNITTSAYKTQLNEYSALWCRG